MDHLIDDNDRLEPCPFCGAEAEIISIAGETDAINTGAQCVQCTSSACGASSALIYPRMDDVTNLLMELWNKRRNGNARDHGLPLGCTETENSWGDLRKMWADADKKAKDWRDADEEKLLRQMSDAREGLKSLGWRDGQYAPKDGTRFLSIESGSTGVFPCYWMDNNLMAEGGGFWIEAHVDLWPATPTLWKPMSSNA